MKKITLLTLTLSITFISFGQNQTNMYYSGELNSFGAAAMTYEANKWQVTLEATAYDDISNFLFRNSNSNYDNKWSRGSTISLGNIETAFYSGADTNIEVLDGNYYTFNLSNVSIGINGDLIVQKTTNAPITFDGTTPVSAIPTLYPGEDLNLTITLSGGKSAEEKAFIRYSDDGYANSIVSEVTFTGANDSSGSGTIPGAFNTAGNSVEFYVYTTTVSAIDSSNHDLITLDLANNGGSNYSYSVEPFTPGDIAFAAYNADGDDDFAIVALADIPANSTIYFTDNESDGSGGLTTGEGTISWSTGAFIIKAGTVIVFTDLLNDGNPNFGSSLGSISRSGAFNIGASKDGLLAFNGTDATTPTSFIAALQIGNEPAELGPFDGDGITLTNTGLVIETSIIVVDNSASPDGGIYTGSRSSQSSYSDYYALLSDNSTNWSTSTTDGESLLPFSQEAFTISSTNWTGSASDVWNLAGNWDNGIPTTSSLATIPDVTTPPIISSGTEAQAGNIVINSGENLTVNSSNSLTVTGLAKLESGSSLIVDGTLSGIVNYNRNIPTGGTDPADFYLISSPVVGQDIDKFVSAEGLAIGTVNTDHRGLGDYNNSTPGWEYYLDGASGTGNFVSGDGRALSLAAAGDVSFTGTLPTSDIGILITSNTNGFNLVGNPFPSYIAANDPADGTNNLLRVNDIDIDFLTEATIWLWDEPNDSYEPLNNTSGAFYIAPAQGFFVSSNGTNIFSITELMQSHQSSDSFQRSTSTRPEIQLVMTDGSSTRDTDIFYINGTSTGFDNGYDSSIFGGVANDFAVYTHAVANGTGRDLGIQSLPDSNYEDMVIPIGVNADAGANLTFTANVQNLPDGLKVILEDTQSNSFTQLDVVNGEYNITIDNTLSGIGRFYLHTTAQVLGLSDLNLNNISIYTTADNTILNIVGLDDGRTELQMFDLTGKRILDISFLGNRVNTIALPELNSGIYIVKLESESGSLNKKIIVD